MTPTPPEGAPRFRLTELQGDTSVMAEVIVQAFRQPPHRRDVTPQGIASELERLREQPSVRGILLWEEPLHLCGVAIGVSLRDTIEVFPALYQRPSGEQRSLDETFYGHYIAILHHRRDLKLGQALHCTFLASLPSSYKAFLAFTPSFNARALAIYQRYGAILCGEDQVETPLIDRGMTRVPITFFEQPLPLPPKGMEECRCFLKRHYLKLPSIPSPGRHEEQGSRT